MKANTSDEVGASALLSVCHHLVRLSPRCQGANIMNYLGTVVTVTITIHAEGTGDSCPKLL